MPLLPSLSSAPKMFLFAMSEAVGTAPTAPLVGTTLLGLRGILADGWLERPPLPMPLTSPVSERDGDDLRPGKLSSSFAAIGRLKGEEELTGPLFSMAPRIEAEPGRLTVAVETLDKLWPETIGVAWLPTGVDTADEPITLFLAGGVLATVSELLSWEAESSTCSWTTPCWLGAAVAWKGDHHPY